MTSSFQLLQRRFGHERPGMQLIAVEEAAVPVTIVHADVLAQEKKPLLIIEEFLLRLVEAGVPTGRDIAEMLGLPTEQILDAAAIQVSDGNLRRWAGKLSLTAKGAEVVRDLAATQPVLKTLPVVFDRLVWRLTDYSRSTLLTKKEAQEQGRQILPPAQKARISLGDVTAESFNALLSARSGMERRVEILRIRKISPNTHRFMPVQLLVYGDPERREIDLAVCLEGELQPEHGLALDAINAVNRLGLSVGPAVERPLLDPDLESQRVDVVEVAQLAAEAEEGAIPSKSSALATLAVRSVGVFEHPDLLMEALDTSMTRLLIISPWVRSAVVTTDFVTKLERRLRAGVEVTIAHGYGDDDSGSDDYALKRLRNLSSRYHKKFTFARLGNTHAKILIFDNQWVSTSFNWLSFRGDPDRTYRMEEGTLVSIPEKVDEAYARYRVLVAEQKV